VVSTNTGQQLIRDDKPVDIGIGDARFNPQTGVATWNFTAIDPETGEFTEDPLAGFLPPNDTNHAGEGFVKFSVKPKQKSNHWNSYTECGQNRLRLE
jgi:hypothetical protein